jgi:fructokinase
VKLNDLEITIVQRLLGETGKLGIEDFCRKYRTRFRWDAVCVTRAEKGCGLLMGDTYVEAPACPVTVADAIGAGDAFAAGLVHALSLGWKPARAAEFANRVGALVASRAGAIPAWSLQELDRLPQPSAI